MGLSKYWQRIRVWGAAVWEALQAGPGVRSGIWWATVAGAVLVAATIGGSIPFGIAGWLDPVLGTVLALLVIGLLMLLTAGLYKLLQLLSGLLTWRAFLLLAGTVAAVIAASSLLLLMLLPVLLPILVLGAVLGVAGTGGLREAGIGKRVVTVVVGLTAVIGLVLVVVSYARRGSDEHLVAYQRDPVSLPALQADDPSQPGPYQVLTISYGSGDNHRRPEYGAEADLLTETVDASPFVKGNEGWKMKLRKHYWGFDVEHFPVNGRVWYPAGDGPFPIVLMVHGNHGMEEYSDPGYAWLGELLASRGFIFVSVDENFFNGSWRGGLESENDGRGWMLLEHLRVWRGWNGDPDSPFYGKVDLQRIALTGHSRGGEAAAIACALNRLSRYPDDATVELDYGFDIRAVIAIAPCDGQYMPAGQPTPLEDVSYLVLQGAHDSDVSTFAGIRQYQRVRFTEEEPPGSHLKAAVYSYRSNHGQFNTVWGDDDWGWPGTLWLNRKPLLDGAQQRQLGAVYISAFLELTLQDRDEYRPLLRDHRVALAWLPEDFLITRYQDASYRAVADYEEDVDVTTGQLDGVRITGTGLAVWREEQLGFRKHGSKQNGVVVLGWRNPSLSSDGREAAGEEPESGQEGAAPEAEEAPAAGPDEPSYSLVLPEGAAEGLQLSPSSRLVFALADKGEEPPEEDEEDEEGDDASDRQEAGDDGSDGAGDANDQGDSQGNDSDANDANGDDDDADEKDDTPLDLSIELETADGVRARIALSSVRMLVPDLSSRFTKLPKEDGMFGSAWEPTLQTFELPLARFQEVAPDLDPDRLSTIRFVFDRSATGMVILDEVGFSQ